MSSSVHPPGAQQYAALGADRWAQDPPNGAPMSPGRGRVSPWIESTPALWRSVPTQRVQGLGAAHFLFYDVLSRATPGRHLIESVNEISQRGIGFRSSNEDIDTTTPGGKLVFHVFGALAEFERDLIRERTQAALRAARARGRVGGGLKALDPKKVELLQRLYADPANSIDDICRTLRISRTTL
jgi:hypothetical protein